MRPAAPGASAILGEFLDQLRAGRAVQSRDEQVWMLGREVPAVAATLRHQEHALQAIHVLVERNPRLPRQEQCLAALRAAGAVADVEHGPLAAQELLAGLRAVGFLERDGGQRPGGIDDLALVGAARGAPVTRAVVQPERDEERHEEDRGHGQQLPAAAANGILHRGSAHGRDVSGGEMRWMLSATKMTRATTASANHCTA